MKKNKLSRREKLITCPNCKNETFLVNKKFEYDTCVNINCGYWKKKSGYSNYIDFIEYSEDKNYNIGIEVKNEV